MNILKSEEDIYGKHSQEELHKATKDFFIVSRSIKNKLEDKSYKLDQYLSAIMKVANCKLNTDAAEDGRQFFSGFRRLCLGILNYDSSVTSHEFYQTAKEYIAEHRFSYKERHTLLNIYCALLTPQFTDYAVNKFSEEIESRANIEVDTVLMSKNYELIAKFVGEEDMKVLNMAIKGRFIISSIMNSFLQSITNEYLHCLLHRDPETSKQVYQLIFMENLYLMK